MPHRKILNKIRQHPHFFGFLFLIIAALLLFFLFTHPAQSISQRIDIHEHIESTQNADDLIGAMNAKGFDQVVLVPSPEETITLNGKQSFTNYEVNTDVILDIAKKYPDRFIPFCTLSPLDTDALKLLTECVERGGKGLKLYNGHSFFYEHFGTRLDSPRMKPIYAFAERRGLPILFHVNISKFRYELENVLKDYPDLRVVVPHFMVSSTRIEKVMEMMDTFPNLYTDVSFGHDPYMAAGFRRISNSTAKYRNFFSKYSDRILFGADMVLTMHYRKDQAYIEAIFECYRDLLEKRSFKCDAVSDYYLSQVELNEKLLTKCKNIDTNYCKSKREKARSSRKWYEETQELRGLNLSSRILERIYAENPSRWLGE